MKRVIAVIGAAMVAMVLAGCGGSGAGSAKDASDAVDKGTETNAVEAAPASQSVGDPEVAETVLVDEAGVRITATGLDNKLAGPVLKLLVENNSGQDLIFQSRNVSVNGYMIDALMSTNVADGKKANDKLTFARSALQRSGIETFADIQLSFHIFSSDGWETYLDTAPIDLPTSIADSYSYEYDDSGEVLYEGEGVKVIAKGLSENASYLGPGVVVEVINERDASVIVQTRDTSINGFMVDPVFSCEVTPGKRAINSIDFIRSLLEENGIESIDEVALSFHIFESDGWTTIVDTDPITITF